MWMNYEHVQKGKILSGKQTQKLTAYFLREAMISKQPNLVPASEQVVEPI